MQIKFYATQNDLFSGLDKIESQSSLQYIRFGVYDSPQYEVCRTLIDNKLLRNSNSFLVTKLNQLVSTRPEKANDGRQIYIIDQIGNPHTIIFVPSEYYHQCFKYGYVRTDSKNSISIELFRYFSRTLKEKFTRIHGRWIGPEALSYINERKNILNFDEICPR